MRGSNFKPFAAHSLGSRRSGQPITYTSTCLMTRGHRSSVVPARELGGLRWRRMPSMTRAGALTAWYPLAVQSRTRSAWVLVRHTRGTLAG